MATGYMLKIQLQIKLQTFESSYKSICESSFRTCCEPNLLHSRATACLTQGHALYEVKHTVQISNITIPIAPRKSLPSPTYCDCTVSYRNEATSFEYKLCTQSSWRHSCSLQIADHAGRANMTPDQALDCFSRACR